MIEQKLRSRLLPALHVLVLAGALALIAYITYDTLLNVSFVDSPEFLRVQMWICLFFEAEIFIEFLLSQRKLHFLARNLVFILICVPYSALFHHLQLDISPEIVYMLRFLPMVRAAYVMAMTWDIMSKNWITNMFGAYIIMLLATLYFLSLVFYVEETSVNPDVWDYGQALWYSVMQMTTCGSDITAVTLAGKIIGVVLSAEGLVLFPVFTVYFTHAFARTHADAAIDNKPEVENVDNTTGKA